MATVLTVSHSLKRESICQNVSISLRTHSHIYTVHNTFIHDLCTASLLRLSFLWVYICAGLWCANGRILFSDVLISDPKQSELTIFQKNKKQKTKIWPFDTFYSCSCISLRSLSVFNKQTAFFSWKANPRLLEMIQFLMREENTAERFRHSEHSWVTFWQSLFCLN